MIHTKHIQTAMRHIALIALLAFGASCTQRQETTPLPCDTAMTDSIYMYMVKDQVANTDSVIYFHIVNNASKEIHFGTPFFLEQSKDGKWIKVEFPAIFSFTDIGYSLAPHNTCMKDAPLYPLFHLETGKYRIGKPFRYDERKDSIYCEFWIVAPDTVPERPNAEFPSPLTGNVSPTGKSGLTLSVAQPTFRIDSTEFVETILQNEGDDTLTVGRPYYLERFCDGKWMRIDLSHDAEGRVIAFNSIGYNIRPGEELRQKRRLWKDVYRYTPGRYRIVMPHHARPGQEEPEWLAVEFRLE